MFPHPLSVAPVYEEAAKAKTTEKDKKAAEKSDKKGKKAINKTEGLYFKWGHYLCSFISYHIHK